MAMRCFSQKVDSLGEPRFLENV
jgi:glutamate dehydrogenase (NAD(P)+)